MRRVGVRALRDRLSEILDQVQAGETVLVTNRGQVVARIEPPSAEALVDAPAEVRRLIASGRATWGGRPLEDFDPIAITPGPAVSDILLAQRGPAVTVAPRDAVPGQ